MTGRPPRYTHELVDHLLQELERGRTLVDICAEPGMPSGTAVRRWIDENINGFAARYRTARGRPAAAPHLEDLHARDCRPHSAGGGAWSRGKGHLRRARYAVPENN